MENSSFENKVILVTGGVTGIGKAIGQKFRDQSGRVFLLDRDPDTETLAQQMGCRGRVCDVSSAQEVEKSVDLIIEECQRIDVLVNNAGIVRLAKTEALTEDDWDQTFLVNTKAIFLLSKKIIPHMRKNQFGRIINISSQASIIALDQHLAYCASKAAVDAMTRVMALEYGSDQITVNSVAPTVIMTELGKKAWAGERGEKMKQKIPSGRFGQPEEVAHAVSFLASDSSGLINGHTLVIDGGYSIQ